MREMEFKMERTGLLEVGGGEIGAFARRGADRGDHPRRDRVRGLRPTVPHRAVWPHLPPLPEPAHPPFAGP